MKDSSSTKPFPLIIVPTTENITPIASHSERTNKRDIYDSMDTKEEDIANTPQKYNIEET